MKLMNQPRTIITTAALPYANGDIHVGHILEYLSVDIRNRALKMLGHRSLYICGDDTHGTPIMISAQKEGIRPEDLIARSQARHLEDFSGFDIKFDHYGSTHSESNRAIAEEVYFALKAKGYLSEKSLAQFFCEHDKMFLPDRFVKGECPRCGALDQYGDNCEVCGATFASHELKNPRCYLCSNKPVLKDSQHVFFELEKSREFLLKWVEDRTEPGIANKLKEWLGGDLKSWCISRDAPYFGFEIPDLPNKYFYVWLDAPLGYLSFTKDWAEKQGLDFKSLWQDPNTEVYHCVGKDITYFHCLFFPAMLQGAGYRSANHVFVHGYVTVNGAKMSKSRGTQISARHYLQHLDASYLRYYYACKINSGQDDIDFNIDDFMGRINGELVGKIVNIASRGAQMLGKNFSGIMGKVDQEGQGLLAQGRALASEIAADYAAMEFQRAMGRVRVIADLTNKYFDEKKPWLMMKDNPEAARVVLTVTLNLFRQIAIYLKPVLPKMAKQTEELLQEPEYTWQSLDEILEGRQIQAYVPLATRIEPATAQALIGVADNIPSPDSAKKTEVAKVAKNSKPAEPKVKEATSTTSLLSFDDFAKVDLRVGLIEDAKTVEGSDKLLQLTVNLGALGMKNIFSGIRERYSPDELKGKSAVFVANLAPRKMRFGISEGMLLCAGDGASLRFLVPESSGSQPGDKIS